MNLAQKIKVLFVLFALLFASPLSTLPVHSKTVHKAEVKLSATDNYGKLPLSFEANLGQSAVKFLSRGNGYTVFLTPTEAVLSLRGEDKKETIFREMGSASASADSSSTGVLTRL